MTNEDDGSDPTVERALDRLGAAVVPVKEPAELDQSRAQLLPALSAFAERSFEERVRKRRWAVRIALAAGVLTVGAAVLVVRGLRNEAPDGGVGQGSAAVLSRNGEVRVESEGSGFGALGRGPVPLRDHDRVETLDGHAEVRLASGAAVTVDPRTRLDLEAVKRSAGPVEEKVALPSGRISVRVPKLGAEGRFVVATPNATVTVHGTVFAVEVDRAPYGADTETRVSVSEGLVSVASHGREVFLRPGASWSSASAEVQPSAEVPAAGAAAPIATTGPVAGGPRPSTLADENALFKAALGARRAGHPEKALELVGKLLARYPTSPLAEQARAERARAEAELGKPGTP